jgi:hypothetical protein
MGFFDNLDQGSSQSGTVPQGGFDQIDLEDLLSGNADQLFNQFGMDRGGDNEAGAVLRRYIQGIFPVLMQRLAAQNLLNPAVMQSIQRLAQALSPEGQESLAGEQSARLMKGGAVTGEKNAARLRDAGASGVVQEGARISATNKAVSDANDFRGELFSPSQMAKNSAALVDLQGGLTHGLLGDTLAAGGFVEGRSNANKADKRAGSFMGQLGSFTGMLGELYGMGDFFGGAGGGAPVGSGGGFMNGGDSMGNWGGTGYFDD